jgi:hypothetical protein
MTEIRGQPVAAVGFAVKTGWASAVLVNGSTTSPQVVDSRRIELSDPRLPESRQPYHDGFGTARRHGAELSRLIASVQHFGRRSVTEVIRHYQKIGYRLCGVGIVVGSLIDPDEIGNEHIRIHALEGRLFRGVVEDAAARGNLARSIWRARDLYAVGVESFGRSEQMLRDLLATLGKTVPGAWRAEQKSAALAAWLTLARPLPTRNRKPAG